MPRVSHTTTRTRQRLRLAPGIELHAGMTSGCPHLRVLAGEVQLNASACAILTLCDGSRSRSQVVLDAVSGAGGAVRASDVREFLEAALGRGWLVAT